MVFTSIKFTIKFTINGQTNKCNVQYQLITKGEAFKCYFKFQFKPEISNFRNVYARQLHNTLTSKSMKIFWQLEDLNLLNLWIFEAAYERVKNWWKGTDRSRAAHGPFSDIKHSRFQDFHFSTFFMKYLLTNIAN